MLWLRWNNIASDHPALAETRTAGDIRSWIELVPE
jgi:hypothetical protein